MGDKDNALPQLKSCGVLLIRKVDGGEKLSDYHLLLMRHRHRIDFTKGHLESGEDEKQCAVRELFEETGIPANDIRFDEVFVNQTSYKTKYKRKPYNGSYVNKTVVLFLAYTLKENCDVVRLGEHAGRTWFDLQTIENVINNKRDNTQSANVNDELELLRQTHTIYPVLADVVKYIRTLLHENNTLN